jgi:hypothetical protein
MLTFESFLGMGYGILNDGDLEWNLKQTRHL